MTTERFDLDLPYTDLDMESTLALADLVAMWSARARLRQRWIDRNDPELDLARYELVAEEETHDMYANDWK